MDFREVIQAGWTGVPRPASSFSQLREAIAGIIKEISTNDVHELEKPLLDLQLACAELVMEEEHRWMGEEDYRAACKAEGYEAPDDIWT
jgi:hypothetical protein